MAMETSDAGAGNPTTLMLRFVPPRYSQRELLAEIVQVLGDPDACDYFYLPWDSTRNSNCGFAFVNLKDADRAKHAAQVLDGYRFAEAGRPCIARPARNQGAEANVRSLIDRLLSGSVRHPPYVMWNGRDVDICSLASAIGNRIGELDETLPKVSYSLADLSTTLQLPPSTRHTSVVLGAEATVAKHVPVWSSGLVYDSGPGPPATPPTALRAPPGLAPPLPGSEWTRANTSLWKNGLGKNTDEKTLGIHFITAPDPDTMLKRRLEAMLGAKDRWCAT